MSPRLTPIILTGALFALVVFSALAVVTNIDTRRQLFAAMQVQRAGHDQVAAHWRQLLLEQAALSAEVAVESIAQKRLKMKLPGPELTIVVSR
jgi:cell division protein FtsL